MSQESPSVLASHFTTAQQQREAGRLGMWLFLATEVMLFGAILLAIATYRFIYWPEFAEATQHLKLWIGGINTGVLLTSSLFMALAVVAAREGRIAYARTLVLVVGGLGLLFLCIKGYEYWLEYQEGLFPGLEHFSSLLPAEQLLLNLYFASTSLHALHVVLGVATLGWLFWSLHRTRPALPPADERVEGVGLYWHLVDVVWVLLYPSLYLLGR
jgi:cytochrome c oxidase subunit III